MQHVSSIAVIGGGAAGLMAAIVAARAGASVTMYERQDRVGKKILVTGNGRCNLTNRCVSVAQYHGDDPSFVVPALARFSVAATREFFHDLGLCTCEEDAGKIFPITGQASNVLDILRAECDRCGVTTKTQCEVIAVEQKATIFRLRMADGEASAQRVIVAGGGKAFPHLSGTSGGIELLKQLRHTLTTPFPALVPLKTELAYNKQLKGLKVPAGVQLEVDGHVIAHDRGEILFTDYGLSGPPVIQLSLLANAALQKQQAVSLVLDLFTDWSSDELQKELRRRFSRFADMSLDSTLIGLIHKRLIPVILHEAGIATTNKLCRDISSQECAVLSDLLKRWRINVTGSLSWNDAHVMAGGIRTADFDPQTLQSRIVPGLWAAGEILDITGDCGGYNLQWAWSSGFLAGSTAAQLS